MKGSGCGWLKAVLSVGFLFLCWLSVAAAAEWYVVCDVESHKVIVTENVDEQNHRIMKGPLPGTRTAEVWLEGKCPDRYCDGWGQCAEEPSPTGDSSATGGWVAGEVTSVTLSDSEVKPLVPPTAVGPTGPGGPSGPSSADLSPLIDNARAAVEACSFPAALMTAEHMMNFDPEHPWLAANLNRLRDLSLRQRSAEDAVWQASSALSSGDLKRARSLARGAADRAVSCQSRAVSDLLNGIDAAIEHKRQLRAANNSRAMSALLPDLINMANTLSGQYHGTASSTNSAPVYGGTNTPSWSTSSNMPDPCAFKYEYRNVWNVEPVCTCPGYRWEAKQHRCVR
ncbi:MAG: hypothetical protein GY906_09625 [bacterium]|nr:hypothetical protein [bacterium]